jgi:hypothetical protein
MKIPEFPFTAIDWSQIDPIEYPGETGKAVWRTINAGDLRVRMVEYSPGYAADHWCARGHVLLIVAGEMTAELQDGRQFVLKAGMGYMASDDAGNPHRSHTATGCRLFIVD